MQDFTGRTGTVNGGSPDAQQHRRDRKNLQGGQSAMRFHVAYREKSKLIFLDAGQDLTIKLSRADAADLHRALGEALTAAGSAHERRPE